MPKPEAKAQDSRYSDKHYPHWFQQENAPVLSHTLFKTTIAPEVGIEHPTLLVGIDNLRCDQWKTIEATVNAHYKVKDEMLYYSILPTATQYARNAIFSGHTPKEMETHYPKYWKNDTDEGGKNLYEDKFLETQLKRLGLSNLNHEYIKITN